MRSATCLSSSGLDFHAAARPGAGNGKIDVDDEDTEHRWVLRVVETMSAWPPPVNVVVDDAGGPLFLRPWSKGKQFPACTSRKRTLRMESAASALRTAAVLAGPRSAGRLGRRASAKEAGTSGSSHSPAGLVRSLFTGWLGSPSPWPPRYGGGCRSAHGVRGDLAHGVPQ